MFPTKCGQENRESRNLFFSYGLRWIILYLYQDYIFLIETYLKTVHNTVYIHSPGVGSCSKVVGPVSEVRPLDGEHVVVISCLNK